jgi:hypothetical protein
MTVRFKVSRNSSVGIATSYWLDVLGVGVRVAVVSRNFTSPCRSDRVWDHRTYYPMGTGGKAAGT